MIGYVVTTHKDNFDLIDTALKSLLEHCSKNKYLVVFDNEGVSKKKEQLLEKYKGVDEYIHIEDQSIGGLTYTWNTGIDICLQRGCDGVIILNHDIECNDTLHFLEESVLGPNEKGVYSCTSDRAPWGNHLNQQSYIKYAKEPKVDKHKNSQGPGGFCLAIPKDVLHQNKFDKDNYFDPTYHFGGNEAEYNNRWYKKGGYCYIVRNCFIKHSRLNSWVKLKNGKRKPKV